MAEVNPKPGSINDKTGFREFSDDDVRKAAESAEKTKPGSHRATARGYANGELIEPGKPVPADVPVSDEWMEPVGGKRTSAAQADLARAVEEAQDPQPGDIDLEQVKGDALTAHALRFGINRGKLGDDKLRDAVRAAYDRDRTI